MMGEVGYELRVEARDGYVYVLQRGTFTTEQQLRELQGLIVAEAWRAKTDRVLFDNREATQATEDLRAVMWTWLSSTAPIRRAAILVHSERITKRADRTAKMNRVMLQAFNDEDAAREWLLLGVASD